MVIFETDRLLIREFDSVDARLVMQYSQEKCNRIELPDDVFETIEESTNEVNMYIENYDEMKYPLVYAIVLKSENILIGHIGLCTIEIGLEIEYSISENYQGKGYATEAIKSFLKWEKENLHLNVIYGFVKKSNIASWKALEKAGFTLEYEKQIHYYGEPFTFKKYSY